MYVCKIDYYIDNENTVEQKMHHFTAFKHQMSLRFHRVIL